MSDNLFTDRDLYKGDPLHPDRDTVTPASIVATLTKTERETRVTHLTQQAHTILDEAITTHQGTHRIAATCILFSGGNDSTILTHLMRGRATHAAHANTTIGIEQTRQFVRDTCHQWQLPLIEKQAPTSYRELVLDQGFPGPAMHYKMYQRLKERPLHAIRNELITNPHRERVVFIAGRRRSESKRRENIPAHERNRSIIWASPLIMWTKPDMVTYRLMHRDVPVNEVSDLLHMSGECLCGAYAKPNELDEIRDWFPEVAAEIDQLQTEVAAAGHDAPFNTWGHGRGKPPEQTGMLCSSCEWTLDLDLGEAS